MKTKAAILVEQRQPLVIDELELPALGFGHVLVEVKATRICGSQLGEIDGAKGPDKFLPHLLGHEAGGIVREVGPEVSHVKPGDRVVLHWRPSLGIQARPTKYLWRGREVNAGPITTFQQFSVVSENRLTKVDDSVSFDLACLLADTLSTGIGTVTRNARLQVGESVLVVGVGGIGLGSILGASLAGAYPVIAADIHNHKLEMAAAFGATHVVNTANADLTAEVKAIVPTGVDLAIDATGQSKVIDSAWRATQAKGRLHLIGVMKQTDALPLNTLPLHYGKVITGSEGGSTLPQEDFPRYLRLLASRKIQAEKMITHRTTLEGINEAISRMRAGESIHTVVEF